MKAAPQNSSNLFYSPFDFHFICLILNTRPHRFFRRFSSTAKGKVNALLAEKGIIFIFHTQDVKIDSLHSKIKGFKAQLHGIADIPFFMYRIGTIFG